MMAEWRWFISEGHGFPRTAKDKTCLGIKCKLRRREGVGNPLGGGMSPRVGPSIIFFTIILLQQSAGVSR